MPHTERNVNMSGVSVSIGPREIRGTPHPEGAAIRIRLQNVGVTRPPFPSCRIPHSGCGVDNRCLPESCLGGKGPWFANRSWIVGKAPFTCSCGLTRSVPTDYQPMLNRSSCAVTRDVWHTVRRPTPASTLQGEQLVHWS